MKQSPARTALVLLFIFIGCFGVAYAAAGVLTALPAPAVGGTCGPSTGSETAFEALARPGSIGAGPEPPASNATAHSQWITFVQQCQSLADRRGLASLAVLVISLAIAAIGLIWVLRRPRGARDADESIDGTTGWPVQPGPGDTTQLVGAGAVIAPPPAAAVGAWTDPYAQPDHTGQQPWPAQPAAPAPYPYGGPPPYPPPYAPPYPYPAPSVHPATTAEVVAPQEAARPAPSAYNPPPTYPPAPPPYPAAMAPPLPPPAAVDPGPPAAPGGPGPVDPAVGPGPGDEPHT